MKWLRKIMGTDFPDPQVGQVWRSRNSGRSIRVAEVEIMDDGTVRVCVQYELHGVFAALSPGRRWSGIPDDYAYGLNAWRCQLRDSRRELIGMEMDCSARGGRALDG